MESFYVKTYSAGPSGTILLSHPLPTTLPRGLKHLLLLHVNDFDETSIVTRQKLHCAYDRLTVVAKGQNSQVVGVKTNVSMHVKKQ